MAKIIAVAENYAYGPVGKLLTVTKKLLENGHEITFIGEGTAYQLGSKESFQKIIKINTNAENFQEEMESVFKESDFILSCMDRSSVIFAEKLNIPVIWIDTLFWWYDEIPDYMLKVDCYIKQNTLNDAVNYSKYADRMKNLHSVGPIVDLSPLKSINKKNQVLVAYGGMEGEGVFRVGVDSHYPYVVTDLLVNQVDFSRFDKVIITGNERVIKELELKYGNEKFIFCSLSHDKFVQELADSKISLMVPGLETPLEAFSYDIPTFFLPPLSSSQYVQLNDFIDRKATEMYVHFTDFYPSLNFSGKNMAEMLKMYLEQLHIFENDVTAQKTMVDKINQFINLPEMYEKQIGLQRKFMETLGGNGTKKCIDIIEDFINDKN